jgi:uncharacterized protein YqeY
MSLMNTIRTKQLAARKIQDISAIIYTVLLGEAAMIGKNDGNRETTDAEVIAVVRKFIKNNEETMQHIRTSNPAGYEGLADENKMLSELLPTQLTEAQLRQVVTELKEELGAGPKDMGRVMARLKTDYEGQYDGRMASTVVKEVLL